MALRADSQTAGGPQEAACVDAASGKEVGRHLNPPPAATPDGAAVTETVQGKVNGCEEYRVVCGNISTWGPQLERWPAADTGADVSMAVEHLQRGEETFMMLRSLRRLGYRVLASEAEPGPGGGSAVGVRGAVAQAMVAFRQRWDRGVGVSAWTRLQFDVET